MVGALADGVEHRQGHRRRQLAPHVARELLADESGNHRGHAFARLERHVAHKAVADHDVGGALEDVVTLHVAMEVQVARGGGLAQQLPGLLDYLVALDDLFADVEQAHRGVVASGGSGHQGRAHHRELQQVFGRAIDVGAEVEHGGGAPARVGHPGGDGGSLDTVQRLEQITSDRHQRPGVAGRHRGLGVAVLHLLDRHAHGRVLLAAQGDFDRVAHFHDLGRGHDRAPFMVLQPGPVAQCVGASHQQETRLGVAGQEGLAGGHGHGRPDVSPHAIHSDGDHLDFSRGALGDLVLMKKARMRHAGPCLRGQRTRASAPGGQPVDQASDLFLST